MDVHAQKGNVKIVALVRNKNGEPQFTDFNNIPEEFHETLTEEDWVYINKMRQEKVQ